MCFIDIEMIRRRVASPIDPVGRPRRLRFGTVCAPDLPGGQSCAGSGLRLAHGLDLSPTPGIFMGQLLTELTSRDVSAWLRSAGRGFECIKTNTSG
jgi:hypothetical protein